MSRALMWWKPKHNCWFVQHVLIPDEFFRKTMGLPEGYEAEFNLLVYPSKRAFHRGIVSLWEAPPENLKGTGGVCIAHRKTPPEIIVPVTAPRRVLVHEAVHAALAIARKEKWDIRRGQPEERLARFVEHISEVVTRDVEWVKKQRAYRRVGDKKQ